jgi:hypothetical protein
MNEVVWEAARGAIAVLAEDAPTIKSDPLMKANNRTSLPSGHLERRQLTASVCPSGRL